MFTPTAAASLARTAASHNAPWVRRQLQPHVVVASALHLRNAPGHDFRRRRLAEDFFFYAVHVVARVKLDAAPEATSLEILLRALYFTKTAIQHARSAWRRHAGLARTRPSHRESLAELRCTERRTSKKCGAAPEGAPPVPIQWRLQTSARGLIGLVRCYFGRTRSATWQPPRHFLLVRVLAKSAAAGNEVLRDGACAGENTQISVLLRLRMP